MPKPPPLESTEPAEPTSLEEDFYEVPEELGAEPAPEPPPPARKPRRSAAAGPAPDDDASSPPPDDEELEAAARPRRLTNLRLAIAAALVLCLVAAVIGFRKVRRDRALQDGLARAEQLMRLDTAEGYRKAADLLTPYTQMDEVEAGSAQAFALAMLAADYRDAEAEARASKLLVKPSQARDVPPHAALAFAALNLGKNVLGDATSALSGAPGSPWAQVLQARIALRAGTLEAATEPATAAAAEAGFAPGLAIHGDVARRARHDPRTARAAYEAALAASPAHPRSAYGLAKLALAGAAPADEARQALSRVLGATATPAPERARAALHLAALRLRADEPLETVRADAAAGLDARSLDWLMGAARAEAANHGPYRAVAGAPAALESASDDDPPDLRALPPEPPPPPPPVVEEPKPVPAKVVPHKATAKGAKAQPARKATAAKATAAKPTKSGKAKATAAKPPARKTTRRH